MNVSQSSHQTPDHSVSDGQPFVNDGHVFTKFEFWWSQMEPQHKEGLCHMARIDTRFASFQWLLIEEKLRTQIIREAAQLAMVIGFCRDATDEFTRTYANFNAKNSEIRSYASQVSA